MTAQLTCPGDWRHWGREDDWVRTAVPHVPQLGELGGDLTGTGTGLPERQASAADTLVCS